MRDMLVKSSRETLIGFICQRHWLTKKVELEKDLLFIEWQRQSNAAQQEMDAACSDMQAAQDDRAAWLVAQARFDRADKAYTKADRIYLKMEKLRGTR